ncbi:MAG: hypothetical protein OXG78_14690 [Chloroflexi bacterium]|nr:hypothetical protein [Chloroflexota bacterium]
MGDDLFLARLLSVYFSLVTVAIVNRLALLTGDRLLAVAAPWILALLAYPQYYSQIARVYALLPLICGWVLLSYWQLLRTTPAPRWKWLSFSASVATILYVHYVGILLLAALAVYHTLFVPKVRRWLYVVCVMAASSLPFILWLPVAMRGFTRSQSSLTKAVLSLPEAFLALLRIYSNGLWFIPLVAVALLILHRRRLKDAKRYLAVIAVALLSVLLIVNEVSPILIARRMRYTVVLAVPLSCALAIAFGQLPFRRILCLPLIALWMASSVFFLGSQDLQIYTNRRSLDLNMVPHYQDFIYEANSLPGYNEPILSFHPRHSGAVLMMLHYYRRQLSDWKHVVHMSRDAQGELILESSLSTYASPESIADNSHGIWVLHNPTQTSESALDGDFGWFTHQFNFCKRYVEKPESIIDFYLKSPIPCALVTDVQPVAIRYDNGTELGNLAYELNSDSLTVYLRWSHAVDRVYSFTLQVFGERENKVGQIDRVISGDPIDIANLDLADLSAGEYVVKLIVYDRESKASQPGLLLSSQQPFERAVNVLQFHIPE